MLTQIVLSGALALGGAGVAVADLPTCPGWAPGTCGIWADKGIGSAPAKPKPKRKPAVRTVTVTYVPQPHTTCHRVYGTWWARGRDAHGYGGHRPGYPYRQLWHIRLGWGTECTTHY